jgi:hypothetical protein
MDDEPQVEQLENRIDTLESTIEKMMPSRRDALKMGGAALIGGAAMSGTASAGTNQVGTIGSASQPVDLESEDINNADTITTGTLDSTTVDNSGTVTTQDLVVNGTATGPFGGGAPVLESGDTITVETIFQEKVSQSFVELYNGASKDVLGGVINGGQACDFLYEFSDNQTITKNSGVGQNSYLQSNQHSGSDAGGSTFEVTQLPPAKDVIRIEAGNRTFGQAFGAEVILKD